MSSIANLSHFSIDAGFNNYLRQVKSISSLEPEEEYLLAKRLIEQKDIQAAHRLVTSHLKLVVKVALGYRGYGLPVNDLISEGNLGLMQAVKKFNPDLGYRLSTYAIWWIKASIQEYILKSWSLVKIGTTSAQKKLFFNLKKLKNKLLSNEDRSLRIEEYEQIAKELKILPKEVQEMDIRLSMSDLSLNNTVSAEGESELIDMIPESRPNQEHVFINNQEYSKRKSVLENGLSKLNERERDILIKRRLSEEPATLENLSVQYNISAERVRQIEAKAFEKLQVEARNSTK